MRDLQKQHTHTKKKLFTKLLLGKSWLLYNSERMTIILGAPLERLQHVRVCVCMCGYVRGECLLRVCVCVCELVTFKQAEYQAVDVNIVISHCTFRFGKSGGSNGDFVNAGGGGGGIAIPETTSKHSHNTEMIAKKTLCMCVWVVGCARIQVGLTQNESVSVTARRINSSLGHGSDDDGGTIHKKKTFD